MLAQTLLRLYRPRPVMIVATALIWAALILGLKLLLS